MTIQAEFYTLDSNYCVCPLKLDIPQHQLQAGQPLDREVYLSFWYKASTHIAGILREKYANQIKINNSPDPNSQDPNRIIFLFLRTKHLFDPLTYINLIHRSSLRRVMPIPHVPLNSVDSADHPCCYVPIISIGITDISKSFEHAYPPQAIHREQDYLLDARVKFLDSSIWHRYLYYGTLKKGHSLLEINEQLEYLINLMLSMHRLGMYASNAAQIKLEFQLRLLQNSFLSKIPGSGHSNFVTPFKFHSETAKKKKADELFNRLFKTGDGLGNPTLEGKIKWRVLMVDDQATTGISPKAKTQTSKKDLVFSLLKDYELVDKKDIITKDKDSEGPEKAENMIEWAKKELQDCSYDIIMLDYLLGLNTESRQKEYGFDLLKVINDELDSSVTNSLRRGSSGRFWIFPISSFPFAFSDKLKQLGFQHLTPYWHLSEGADPICTPELFKYNFLHFLEQQLNEFWLTPATLIPYFKNLLKTYPVGLPESSDNHKSDTTRLNLQKIKDDLGIQIKTAKLNWRKLEGNQDSTFAQTMVAYRNSEENHALFFETLMPIMDSRLKAMSWLKMLVPSSNSSDEIILIRDLRETFGFVPSNIFALFDPKNDFEEWFGTFAETHSASRILSVSFFWETLFHLPNGRQASIIDPEKMEKLLQRCMNAFVIFLTPAFIENYDEQLQMIQRICSKDSSKKVFLIRCSERHVRLTDSPLNGLSIHRELFIDLTILDEIQMWEAIGVEFNKFIHQEL